MNSASEDDDKTVLRPGIGPGPAVPVPDAASSAGDSGSALSAGTYIAEFEITSVLGEGGFGIVYVAWDHSLQRRVALKEYMPSSLAARAGSTEVRVRSERHRETFDIGLKSFVNEARLLAQFDHPSLVKVYRFWEANGTAYMVMPLYEGVTLKDTLKRLQTPPEEAWLMQLLAPLTEALAVIHTGNCFHRDIAPDNIILLAGSERPLLLDFGAARRVIGDMTQALTVILKPGYAPIEQYAEVPDMKQGAWTDIYALAASVHFAIMGKTPPTSVGRLLNDNFIPLSQSAAGRYSDDFLRAIDRALLVRPEARTAGVAEFRADLGLPPLGVTDTLAVQSTTPASRTARKPLLVGAAVLALLAFVGGGYWFYTGPEAAPVSTVATTASESVNQVALPASAAKRSFEIREEFNRVKTGQVGDFKLQASASKPTLRIGRDRLSFNVTSARAGYVQVLVLGPDGSLMLLFPNAQASDNKILAGQTLTLPQPSWPLDVVEPAGQEEFLVIVSAQPRDYSELSQERDYIFLKLPTGEQGAELAARWTRSTPLLLGSLRSCPAADCEEYGAASFSVDIVH
jgi:hypothetical protein